MLIKVTQEHIDRGTRTCCQSPVSLAIMEAIQVDDGVEVSGIFGFPGQGFIWEGNKVHRIPNYVWQHVIDFDNHIPVQPIEFELPDVVAKRLIVKYRK